MNSVLLKENVKGFINTLDNDSIVMLAALSVEYQEIMKSGNPEKQKTAYESILDSVKRQEASTGVKVLSAPDDSYIFAINALTGLFQRIHEKQRQAMMPEKKKIIFKSIVDADIWLHNNPNVAVEDMDVATGTSWGYFANHSYVRSVTLFYTDYKKPTGYIYGICEEERSRHYFSSTVEEFIVKWRMENPERECLSVRACKNTRGDSGALFWGVGVSENTSYYVLYRRKVG